MKEKIQKKCFRKVKTMLKSKLNDGNTIKAINSRAVSSVRYGAGIVDWTKEEQKVMDRKTRKLMHEWMNEVILYRPLPPRAEVDQLYFKRSEGGRNDIKSYL